MIPPTGDGGGGGGSGQPPAGALMNATPFKRILACVSVFSYCYFIAIASASGADWTRYASGVASSLAIGFSFVIFAKATFILAAGVLFPKPAHLRVLAIPIYIGLIALGVMLLSGAIVLGVMSVVLKQFCFSTRANACGGGSAIGPLVGAWFVLPGVVYVCAGLGLFFTARSHQLTDARNPERAAARAAPQIWASGLLSVLITGVLFMLVLAGQLLRYHTPAAYQHALNAWANGMDGMLSDDVNLSDFRERLTITCIARCNACPNLNATFQFRNVTIPHSGGMPEGFKPFEMPEFYTAGVFGGAWAEADARAGVVLNCDLISTHPSGATPRSVLSFKEHDIDLFAPASNATAASLGALALRRRVVLLVYYETPADPPITASWHYVPLRASKVSVAIAAAAESDTVTAWPVSAANVELLVRPTFAPNSDDPTLPAGNDERDLQYQEIGVRAAYDSDPSAWTDYEGPRSESRPGKAAILIAFSVLLTVAIVIALYQFVWRVIAASPGGDAYAHVEPSSVRRPSTDIDPQFVTETPGSAMPTPLGPDQKFPESIAL